jgi:hypothetical protein
MRCLPNDDNARPAARPYLCASRPLLRRHPRLGADALRTFFRRLSSVTCSWQRAMPHSRRRGCPNALCLGEVWAPGRAAVWRVFPPRCHSVSGCGFRLMRLPAVGATRQNVEGDGPKIETPVPSGAAAMGPGFYAQTGEGMFCAPAKNAPPRGWTWRHTRLNALHLGCLANALLGPPRQFLVARRDYAHYLLDFTVVRACCSDQDFPGAGSQLIGKQ